MYFIYRKTVFIVVIFGYFGISGAVYKPTVTNEDIRDAILQVVNVVRSTEDKLERHEYRERALGEQLKKALVSLEKRVKLLDPFKGTITRLDERLAAVETILMQKDQRESQQLQRTYDTVDDIQKNLPVIVEKLKNDVIEKISKQPQPKPTISPDDFKKLETKLLDKVDKIQDNINHIQNEVRNLSNEDRNVRHINNKSNESLGKLKAQLNSTDDLLKKYEEKLAEYNNGLINPPAEMREEAVWHNNFLQSLEDQKKSVKDLLTDFKVVADQMHQLPNKTSLDNIYNNTLDILNQVKYNAKEQPDKKQPEIDLRMSPVPQNENTTGDLTKITEILDKMSTKLDKNFDKLEKDVEGLAKFEQVMVQTADSVMDTKRRVEYGVHQILGEMSTLMKTNTKETASAIGDRFDLFELNVLDEENGALKNFTSKIGSEIDQVWRQIGIMHQQMTANAGTLNKLQNQTDIYVNGSLGVMDNMKGKVGQITGRMQEVDENLNYLMGRLSLVTQEFNQIKTGLGKALDEIRGTFKSVEDKIKDKGPGPHNISKYDETNDIDNNTKKRSVPVTNL